jgi:hypothetical protein
VLLVVVDVVPAPLVVVLVVVETGHAHVVVVLEVDDVLVVVAPSAVVVHMVS